MGHYWSEMRGDPTPQETEREHALQLAKMLRRFPASKFTVDELALLLRSDWSSVKENYYTEECKQLRRIARRMKEKRT